MLQNQRYSSSILLAMHACMKNFLVSNSLIPYEESGRFFEQDLVIELDSESFICIEMNKDKNSYSFNRNFMYGMMYIR